MDDEPEQKVVKAKAPSRTGGARKRAPAKGSAAKAKEPKPSTASTRRVKAETARPDAKAPAPRKPKAEADSAEKAPAARKRKTAAPAKAKPARTDKSTARPKAEVQPSRDKPAKPRMPKALPPAPPEPVATEPTPQEEVIVADVAIHPVAPHTPGAKPHDDGLEFGLSPVDLAPDAGVREDAGLGWFIRILAITSVLLLLFNSFAIDKWSREQPVTPRNSQVLVAAQRLHAEMKAFHLDAPLEGMRSVWHRVQAAQWPGSAGEAQRQASGKPQSK